MVSGSPKKRKMSKELTVKTNIRKAFRAAKVKRVSVLAVNAVVKIASKSGSALAMCVIKAAHRISIGEKRVTVLERDVKHAYTAITCGGKQLVKRRGYVARKVSSIRKKKGSKKGKKKAKKSK
jgi:histone H3/H4